MAADLHNHTTASDGTLSPAELVHRARSAGLRYLGITDHDTTSGLTEAAEAATREEIELVPGVELSTDATGREVHILGYYGETEVGPLASLLAEMRAARRQRLEQIIDRLRQAGVVVDPGWVTALAGGESVGRPHVARALVEAGFVGTVAEAFDRYLSRGRPGYVPRRKLHPADAVRRVRAAGGVAVLAHPGLMGDDAILAELLTAGLQGLEAYYPQHTPEQTAHYAELARQQGLIVTGGSDFHGVVERWSDVGTVTVPDEAVARLREAAQVASRT